MSIEIILIPLAVAAYGSWKARSMEKENVLFVETRLKDPELLALAIQSMGGSSIVVEGSNLKAVIGERKISFQPDPQGVLVAHLDTKDKDEAVKLLLEVDKQYGYQVQSAVVKRIKERADGLGMNVVSQTSSDDGSINIILEEVRA